MEGRHGARSTRGAAFLLSKARAVADDTESIAKAAEKAGAETEAEVQQARQQAAPGT